VPNTQALKVEKRRPHQDSKLSYGRPRHSNAECDLQILKQGLPPKLRQQFDNISVDKKRARQPQTEGSSREAETRTASKTSVSAKVSPHINDGLF